MSQIQVPHQFKPREYQLPLLKALDSGIKRAVVVWNRRSGKDKTCWNYMIKEACKKVGTYFYFLPTYTQAKKVIWDNIDNDGFKMRSHIPKELIKGENSQELKIDLINGSVIQLIAADTFEKGGVGTNPVGVVFSEYSINRPEVWDFVRPILAVNKGWALFNFTPRGTNHAHKILQIARDNNDWFCEVLTVDDTKVLTPEDIQKERDEGMSEDLIEQEYYCEFIEGAGAFFRNVSKCVYEGKPDDIDATHRYQIGIDLAKHQDFSVITPIDLHTFKVGEIDRFNQLDYSTQKSRIKMSSMEYTSASGQKPLINIDSTGVGEPIFDDLANDGLNINSYNFTEKSRMDLLDNLRLILDGGKIRLPNNPILLDELKSMQYEYERKGRGKLKVKVPEGVHDDCFVKGTKILTKSGQVSIEKIKAGDLVLTREGYKPVVMTRSKKKKVITNIGLRGTPEHPVILANNEQKDLSLVSDYDKIHVWNSSKKKIEKLSYTEAKDIIDTQTQRGSNTGRIIGDMINGKNPLFRYIVKYGKIIMGRLREVTLSTTRMVIRRITTLAIWKYLRSQNTVNYICKSVRKVGKEFVRCVTKILYTRAFGWLTSVVACVGGEREMVYNLQVSECNEYFANNILVHNCIMSLALAVWQLPPVPIQTERKAIRYLTRDFHNDELNTTSYE